jgi:hypothetical protein
MIDSWAVIDEENEIVVCDAFRSWGQLFWGNFNSRVEFGKIDGVDVECVETRFRGGKAEEDWLRFRQPGRRGIGC